MQPTPGGLRARGIVDHNRVCMSGWSNGAAMAQRYAPNTPPIAAAAVYSAPAPFSDWLCEHPLEARGR